MSVFEEMDEITAFGNDLHCYFVGNCTAFKSPGKFASVSDQTGRTRFSAEGATSEEALRNLIGKIRNNDRSSHVEPKPKPKLPGMA